MTIGTGTMFSVSMVYNVSHSCFFLGLIIAVPRQFAWLAVSCRVRLVSDGGAAPVRDGGRWPDADRSALIANDATASRAVDVAQHAPVVQRGA